MFTSADIAWVKNVKRDAGRAWAYLEFEVGQTFLLDWAAGRANMGRTDAGKCHPNELILIFQTVKNVQGFANGTYLTHLVTPIDNHVRESNRTAYPFSRLVSVVAKNQNPILKPINLNFHKPNRGWLCNIELIEPMNGNIILDRAQKQNIVWSLFNIIDPSLMEVNAFVQQENETTDEATEGEEKFYIGRHKYYERDPKIVKQAKKLALEGNRLKCEVCSFDFCKKYGTHGEGFIECHHTIPIATGGVRKTRIEDLGMVCANCHRMLHRKNTKGAYYTINELKSIYNSQA